jgi:hypothetical protein
MRNHLPDDEVREWCTDLFAEQSELLRQAAGDDPLSIEGTRIRAYRCPDVDAAAERPDMAQAQVCPASAILASHARAATRAS